MFAINIYLALSMLAEVTDGESRQQILDLVGADSMILALASTIYYQAQWINDIR